MCANSTKGVLSNVNSPEIQTADSNNFTTANNSVFCYALGDGWWLNVCNDRMNVDKSENSFSPHSVSSNLYKPSNYWSVIF